MKQEIIRRSECGVKQCDLVKEFGLSKTTIFTILTNKDAIKSAKVAKGVSKLFHEKHRSSIHEEMERLLAIWIKDRQVKGDVTTQDIICHKAKRIYDDLKKNVPGSSSNQDNEEEFKASRGWFFRFKKRCGIHSDEGYCPQQVFNADETGLFWKRMPSRTFITKEEKKLPGHKAMKDRLTLMFSSNASGDLKIKPLLVYHSENPRIFKKNNVIKSKLPVHWKSNQKAWVTQVIFNEWILETFAPAVKKFLLEKELPLKALLILDNAPSHSKDLEEILQENYPFIKVQYLPPNTTSILQPMDQQVIANFKKLYTRALFNKVFEECEFGGDNMTVRKFWKEKFDVLMAIRLIQKAWEEVSQRTLISAWKMLVPSWTQEEAVVDDTEVVKDIITVAQRLELEVEEEDVEELIEEHEEELTTEELQALLVQQQDNAQREASSDNEEQQSNNQPIPTADIKNILVKWKAVQKFTNAHYPDSAEANRINDLYSDTLVRYFRQMRQLSGPNEGNSTPGQRVAGYTKPSSFPSADQNREILPGSALMTSLQVSASKNDITSGSGPKNISSGPRPQ
ncbi:tigger transposable element-derived protein 1-like [Erpetoichthys calabaricus]|uniref:tigger transposable element-derived protein 1-like n=1 Tax=Erpetoichthys calabaricus TaxID=27687 RepID=UPI002233E55E|nr:tigger transposable element-derived protein 1-like [Erpetoichthys calabaricus]